MRSQKSSINAVRKSIHLMLCGVDVEDLPSLFPKDSSSGSGVRLDIFPKCKPNGFGVLFVESTKRNIASAVQDIVSASPRCLHSQRWREKRGITCSFSILVVEDGKSIDIALTAETVKAIASIGGSMEVTVSTRREFDNFKRALAK